MLIGLSRIKAACFAMRGLVNKRAVLPIALGRRASAGGIILPSLFILRL